MDEIVCVECKYIGKPKMKKRGSGTLEFIGWALFPLGVPYSIWRMLAKTPVCKACGSSALLPADGVAGQRLIKIAIGERKATAMPVLPKEPVLTKDTVMPVVAAPPPAPQPQPVQEPPAPQPISVREPPPPESPPEPPPPAQSGGRKDHLDPNVW